jgi:hypothetical protein
MTLSNRQYNTLARTGLAIVILAAIAYDRVPPRFQLVALCVAGVGAFVGFSPLATKNAFSPREQEDHSADELTESSSVVPSAADDASLAPEDSLRPTELAHPSNRSLELYLEHLYSTIGHLAEAENDAWASILLSKASRQSSPIEIYALPGMHAARERPQRIHEMQEIITGLRGSPQEFSVELTSNDSIIVRCERPKESANIVQQMSKRWMSQGAFGAGRDTVN